jgi:hypothetical protein
MAFATLMGWPFVALTALPMALICLSERPLLRLLPYGGMALAAALLPVALTDSIFYGRCRSALSMLTAKNHNIAT